MRTLSHTLGVLVFVVGLAPVSDAHATTYRDLCSSVLGECEYTGPVAPVLAANVCWSRTTSNATLMTGATCPSGSWPYFVKYGVVDPLSQIVTGFVPLNDSCSLGVCLPAEFAPPNTTTAPICCVDGVCWPFASPNCEGMDLSFCMDGVSNEDGTVTCFEQLPD